MQLRPGVLLLCGVIAALAGCASTGPPQRLPASNASIGAFSLNGRIAVKLDDRGYTASLRWRHSATRDSLRLLSPLGTVVGEIETDASGATLVTADKKIYRSNDAQSLTREVLGWDLPLAGLRYWVIGRADPALPVQAQDSDDRQRLKSIMQNGWRIVFLEYFGASALPARLTLAYDRLNLRLIVEHWELPE
ncbi:MAG TPA: lipoprotein insertase outer membrane protein LolB [Burkholderiales bacterium]|nr:lipoprotein insertase outer membrane protein LolB [Burkholderiales bacterium]